MSPDPMKPMNPMKPEQALPPEDREAADVEAWLAGLRGGAGGLQDGAAARREGSCLRAALQQTQAEQAQPALPELAGLLARAEAERLFEARHCRRCAALRRWLAGLLPKPALRPRTAGGLAGAAALALFVWLGLPPSVLTPPHSEAEAEAVLLRSEGGLQLLRHANPRAWRDGLAGELRAAGVQVLDYERFGRYGLDAELGAEPRPALAALLARRGLGWPAQGELRLEVLAVDASPAAP